jgi:uncharacterized protein (DUF58 family)
MLTPDEARLLDRLTIGQGASSPVAASSGVRKARTRGAGAEFHEYRHYQPGDDPRSIDWTVEARLRQLVVRVSRAEGHMAVHALVDASASMSLGSPPKLACAVKAATALCYVAIEGRDAAGAATFTDRVQTYLRPAAGRTQLSRIFDVLGGTTAGGGSSLDRSLESYAAVARGPGLVVVFSDFFDPGGGVSGLQALLHRGLTPAVVQVVAREEIQPIVSDQIELLDVEDEHAAPLVVDAAVVEAYQARMSAHSEALRALCLGHRLPWLRLVAGTGFREMLAAFEAAGLWGLS